MLKKISMISIILSLFFVGQSAFLFTVNRELKSEADISQKRNAELSQQLIFLKSLASGAPLQDLEVSYLRLQTEMATLREAGGTVANAAVRGVQAGQPIITAAKRIQETVVISVPVSIEIKEYKYFEGLLEAIANLNREHTLFESLKYDNGLFIDTRLFGRNVNAQN